MRKMTLTLHTLALFFCVGLMSGCATWGQDKEKADLHLRLGTSQIESGNYPYALRELLQAEKLDSSNPVTQNNLGLVYFFRERYDLAEKHLRKALDMDGKYTEARNNLSRVLIEQGKFVEAEKEVRIVINDLTYANPDKALINLGLAKFNQKDYTAARSAFAKVLSQKQDDCISATYFGRTFFETEDYPRAAETLDRAIAYCQKELYDEPHYFSALAYYRLGEKSKSIARFEELIKYYPDGKYREKSKGMLSLIRKGH